MAWGHDEHGDMGRDGDRDGDQHREWDGGRKKDGVTNRDGNRDGDGDKDREGDGMGPAQGMDGDTMGTAVGTQAAPQGSSQPFPPPQPTGGSQDPAFVPSAPSQHGRQGAPRQPSTAAPPGGRTTTWAGLKRVGLRRGVATRAGAPCGADRMGADGLGVEVQGCQGFVLCAAIFCPAPSITTALLLPISVPQQCHPRAALGRCYRWGGWAAISCFFTTKTHLRSGQGC